jgi:hypothetical protein
MKKWTCKFRRGVETSPIQWLKNEKKLAMVSRYNDKTELLVTEMGSFCQTRYIKTDKMDS